MTRRPPSALALLGLAGPLVVAVRAPEHYRTIVPAPGALLLADAAGRRAWVLVPEAAPPEPLRRNHALEEQAAQLREDFTGRAAELVATSVRPPAEGGAIGQLVIIQYRERKAVGNGRSAEAWEHYFEPPDQPLLLDCGRGQFAIARGRWRVTARGIEHYARGGNAT